jgi:hypothetical protein
MSWVQVGARKINSANICYIDQLEESVLIYFHGQWPGNPVELKADEAVALWKFVKAENVTGARDKGSTMVVPKRITAPMPVLVDANAKPVEDKPKAAPSTAPSAGHHSSSTSQSPRSPQSGSHAQSSKPTEVRKA